MTWLLDSAVARNDEDMNLNVAMNAIQKQGNL